MRRVLLIGHPADSAIKHLLNQAGTADVEAHFLSTRLFSATANVEVDTSTPDEGSIVLSNDVRLDPSSYDLIFQRIIWPSLHELAPESRARANGNLIALTALLIAVSTPVVNRPLFGWQNESKPLQSLELHRHGFRVPQTLSTSEPDAARRFIQSQSATIYKSNSGIRSIVARVGKGKAADVYKVGNCPVLLQERIMGRDVRVHVVGSRVHALAIHSSVVDYRYAFLDGVENVYEVEDVPGEVADLCVSFAERSGLTLAGFDFKVTNDGRWYCLEANPMPSFDAFDRALASAIAIDILKGVG